ncbi:haloacid dehalogenase [Clostridia bacterium]|nr:haloacid dehalogenase [Clostridia bacterium]
MREFENVNAVIFDLDGTLIDSMNMWADIDEAFLLEYGVAKPEGFSDAVKKMTLNEAPQFFNSYISPPLDEEYIKRHIYELAENFYRDIVELKDGVYELFDFLVEKNIPFCIVTATYNYLAKIVTSRLKIDKHSKFLLTPIDISENCTKRSPEIFSIACEKLGFSPDKVLVVEDSLHCIKAAKQAGCKTLGVYDDFSKDDWEDIQKTADSSVISLRVLSTL